VRTYGGSICAVGNLLEHYDAGEFDSTIPSDANISQIILIRSTISNNKASFGGGLSILYSTLKLIGGKNIIENNTGVTAAKQISNMGSDVIFSECPPGKYFSGEVKQFVDNPIKGCPSICPSGKYGAGYAKRVPGCLPCPSGSYCPSIFESPIKCETGRYSAVDLQVSQESCLACNGGKYVNNTGSALCFECAPGKYQDVQGQQRCKPCAQHFFQEFENKKICKSCPAGWVSDQGSTKCQSCEAGTFSSVQGQACKPCTEGQYRQSKKEDANGDLTDEITDPTTCVDCPAGFVSTVDSTTLCTPCSVGKFVDGTSTRCDQCPSGWVQESPGNTSCNAPTPGMIAGAGGTASVKIPDGWRATKCSPTTGICTGQAPCAPGRYGVKSTNSAPECKACPAGQSSFQGTTTCNACIKGRYSPSKGLTCSPCAAGRYQEQFTEPSLDCNDCPSGFTQIKTGEASCIDLGWKQPKDCTNDQYLDNRLLNSPSDWSCVACPQGGSCTGLVSWFTLGPLFGWWKLPESERSNETLFTKCLYPPACLGSANPAFKDMFTDEDDKDPAMVGLITGVNATNTTCAIHLGFRSKSRLCHTCSSANRRKGSVIFSHICIVPPRSFILITTVAPPPSPCRYN